MGEGLLGTLARELAGVGRAEAFARRALDSVMREFDLFSVAVVLDDGTTYATRDALVRPGHLGLHAVPSRVPDDVASAVVNPCTVAHRIERLQHDAHHDPLTGLLNRRAFDEKLTQAIAGAERYGWTFALVVVDLDGLKAINDEHGHYVGDAVLRNFGGELLHSVRVEDVAARLGGDEFGLMVMGAEEGRVDELLERVSRLVTLAVDGVHVTLSAGTALVPTEGTDPDRLYRLADERLYDAKRRA